MEEVLPNKDKEEDDAVIEVRTESGAYALARIERSFPEEQSVPADMVLVQACSANDIVPTSMGLRRANGGAPYRLTEWIPFGTTVYLYSTKGVVPAADTFTEGGDLTTIDVVYGSSIYPCIVQNVDDTPLILLLACEHFKLSPGKHKVTRIGNMYALEERVGEISLQSPVYVQCGYHEVRIPFAEDCTRATIFLKACELMGLDASKYAIDFNGNERVQPGARLVLHTREYAEKRQREMDEEERLAREEYEEKRSRREKGCCFVLMPPDHPGKGGAGLKKLVLGDDLIMVNTLRRAACRHFGLVAEEYEFETDYGYEYARNGMTYVLVKKH